MSNPPLCQHEVTLHVPFHDLDPLGIVWHGNYYQYFDIARFALFQSVNIDLYAYFQKKNLVFPVTRSSAKHILPLKYNDAFICRAMVLQADYKITMDFEIRKEACGSICARGASEQVAVRMPEMEIQFAIPAEIKNALGISR